MKISSGSSGRKYRSWTLYIAILLFIHPSCESTKHLDLDADANAFVRTVEIQLPNQDSNIVKTSWPSIGCWFWSEQEFRPEGFKHFLDMYQKHTSFGLLTTSLRYPGELTYPAIHDQIRAGSQYARQKGIGIVMDLDLRLARQQFLERYPDEQQQILLLREFPLKNGGTADITIKSPSYADHYTYGRTEYAPLKTEVLKVYAYKKEKGLITSASVMDITNRNTAKSNKDSITVSVTCTGGDEALTACALVAVTVFTPDVFAPHLLSYQREILEQYKDAGLAGACKDEWGFPGRFKPQTNDLWYSSYMAQSYSRKRPGQKLLRDMLLMTFGELGKEQQRSAAINQYMQMFWQRNSEIETDYYHAIKEYYGAGAMAATHATWFPFPDEREIFKNGLSWWTSKRDLAQTDESTPFSIRTALAKKMNSPLWYNMYYEGTLAEYHKDLWMAVLGGGRLNYHPVWPDKMENLTTSLLQDSLLIAEARINMLNYISASPVDCPVAVVFGHASALNWANKNGFADVGLEVTNALWRQGYYADLIPSSEIANGSLKLNAEGKVQYGGQQYDAVILYNPEFEGKETVDFFSTASAKGKTMLFSIGDWSADFEGSTMNGNISLPASVKHYESAGQGIEKIIEILRTEKILIQTPGEMRSDSGFPKSVMPNTAGQIRLIDGTVIQASGDHNVMGDPIISTIAIGNTEVVFDAIGIAAIRLDKQGAVTALAAGGLKSLKAGSFVIDLKQRADIVLIRDKGKWRGIIQGWEGNMPAALTRLTNNWTRVKQPVAYTKK